MSAAPEREQSAMMNLSLIVAIVLLIGKAIAAFITGSSAIYSDAAESVTHVIAVGFASWALRLAYKPSDETHHYGHDKVAFISSGFEGAMIFAAAVLIGFDAVKKISLGSEIHDMGIGLSVTGATAMINTLLGLGLIRTGKKRNSPILLANGEHTLSDVWTSVAVLVGLLLVKFTGWSFWDPIVAILAALQLLRTGARLMRESIGGLTDEADQEVEKSLREALEEECRRHDFTYHNLRHRHSGRTHWVEFHLLMPDEMTLVKAHDEATEIEAKIATLIGPDVRVISHLEPLSHEHHVEDWEVR
jgi:cation diffusion facilitator family transporter